ncbi:hypothetical protein ACFVFS_03125 [Kitasatospora sp. NPDC057692]|uniref:hypothetical protein n=1 Tax=Kitasatospora sp. NPDC057692 TaxID=3346215 RepID=UPI0036D017F5
MTTLDQTDADRLPSAAPLAPPSPARPDGGAGAAADGAATAAPVGGATRCSIAAAGTDGRAAGAAGVLPGGTVPRPRGGGDGNGNGNGRGNGSGGRSGGSEDRSDGVAGPERASGGDGGGEGFVRLQRPPAVQDRTVPVLRAAQEELRTVVTRRPAPSRRLRRMHPQAGGALRSDTARPGPAPTADVPTVPGPRTDSDRTGADAQPVAGPEAPLGVLIGGTPNPPEAAGRPGSAGVPGRPEERPAVRAAAELVRLGRGTCLVVLPAWRPAIAVSVPTEHLLSATGLAFERLAGAQLSVVINPAALHDRELELRDWQAGPPGRAGRRGGRRTV